MRRSAQSPIFEIFEQNRLYRTADKTRHNCRYDKPGEFRQNEKDDDRERNAHGELPDYLGIIFEKLSLKEENGR
jgi:hypothetical protein